MTSSTYTPVLERAAKINGNNGWWFPHGRASDRGTRGSYDDLSKQAVRVPLDVAPLAQAPLAAWPTLVTSSTRTPDYSGELPR